MEATDNPKHVVDSSINERIPIFDQAKVQDGSSALAIKSVNLYTQPFSGAALGVTLYMNGNVETSRKTIAHPS